MKLKDSASNVHNCVKNGTTNERGEKISVTLSPNPIQSVPLMKQCIRRIDCLRSACDKNCTRQHCISSTRLENFRYFSEDGKIFLYLFFFFYSQNIRFENSISVSISNRSSTNLLIEIKFFSCNVIKKKIERIVLKTRENIISIGYQVVQYRADA